MEMFKNVYAKYFRYTTKYKDIRNSHISTDWNDMRSITDMNELYAIVSKRFKGCEDIEVVVRNLEVKNV